LTIDHYLKKEVIVKISARNQLNGKVTAVKLGTVMAEVQVKVGSQTVVAAITRSSAEGLGLKVGDDVVAVVKATEVMIARP
jgi:molybdopterin-binding protein